MDPHVPSPRIQKKCILHARAHGHLAIRTAWHPMFPMPTHRIVLLPHQSLFIFFPRPHHFIPSFTRHHFPITFHFTSITLGHIAGPILILKAPGAAFSNQTIFELIFWLTPYSLFLFLSWTKSGIFKDLRTGRYSAYVWKQLICSWPTEQFIPHSAV